MKKITRLFLALVIAFNINMATAQKSDAAVAGALTYGAVPALAIAFYVYAGIAGAAVTYGCIADGCDDGHGGLGLMSLIITAVIFEEGKGSNQNNEVKVISGRVLEKDLSYSAEEKMIIKNDLKMAAVRFGKKKLTVDMRDQNPQLILARLKKQTGVSDLTARYLLAESGIQTEN